MRLLVVDAGDGCADALAGFVGRPEFTVGRLSHVDEAFELLEPGEPAIVFLPIRSAVEPALNPIRKLGDRGANVVILSFLPDPEIRHTSFANGAADVLFAPFTPDRLDQVVMSFLGRIVRSETRFLCDVPALIGSTRAASVEGRTLDLSRNGFKAVFPAGTAPAGVVRIAIKPPAPHAVPVLFARVVSTEVGRDGTNLVRARFVGMAEEERAGLDAFLATLKPEVPDRPTAVAVVDAMDVAGLVKSLATGSLVGIRLPALTPLEREALKSPDAPLAAVSLARCRASLLAAIVEEHPESIGETDRDLQARERWQSELKRAKDLARDELTRRIAAGDPARIRELRDLQARLNAASDQLRRSLGLSQEFRAAVLEKPTVATFERRVAPVVAAPKEPVPAPAGVGRGTRRLIAVGSVLAVVLASFHYVPLLFRRTAAEPASSLYVDAPILRAGSVNVRSHYRQADGRDVAVVDASWFDVPEWQRIEAAREIHAQLRSQALLVRDLQGRRVATIGTDGQIRFGAPPTPGRR